MKMYGGMKVQFHSTALQPLARPYTDWDTPTPHLALQRW
jgi:hypothetical protein